MNRKLVVTLCAVAFCILAGTAVARFDLGGMEEAAAAARLAEGVAKEQQAELKPVQPDVSAPKEQEQVYWLRAADGRLGVFLEDAEHPEMILDVYLGSLPFSDQQALQTGIRAGSYRQLVSMIEDYIS